uniref:Condensation domain-containing protein n=2 Tax=Pyrodinium bahamense TaxID=73915 RepID=A0A7S0FYZ2_9DINO
MGLWRRCSCPGLPPWLAAAACRVARWGFRNAWPRAATGPVPTAAQLPLEVLPLQQSADLAKEALRQARRFAPPFRAALVAFGADGQLNGALLQLQVTHMFSDGFSIVPLLADLGHLIAQAEGVLLPPLAPVPNVLAALEKRLIRTINGDESMRDIITPEPLVRGPTRDKVTIFATLPEFEVTALKRHARTLGISINAVMLAAISVGLAYLEERDSVPVVLVVPQRDGPAESDLVGLFADFRLLRVSCGGLSAMGVALQLHHLIRDRLWLAPGPFTQFSHPWVNFQWTDFEAHHGLRQINDLGTWSGHLSNPISIVVEQQDELSWRLCANFDAKKYSPEARERFFKGLVGTMENLVSDPVALAWPPAPAAEGSEPQAPPATAATGSEHERPPVTAAARGEQQGPPATAAAGNEQQG